MPIAICFSKKFFQPDAINYDNLGCTSFKSWAPVRTLTIIFNLV